MLKCTSKNKKKPSKLDSNFNMGRTTGIEPASAGATNQSVNHFTTYAICEVIISKNHMVVKHNFYFS